MTRIQEMSLDYHFTVEQEVGSSTYAFFGFNGKSLAKFFFYQKSQLSYVFDKKFIVLLLVLCKKNKF